MNCWASVHGFAVLATEGPLRGLTAPERDGLLGHIVLAIDRSYGATTSPDWPALR